MSPDKGRSIWAEPVSGDALHSHNKAHPIASYIVLLISPSIEVWFIFTERKGKVNSPIFALELIFVQSLTWNLNFS